MSRISRNDKISVRNTGVWIPNREESLPYVVGHFKASSFNSRPCLLKMPAVLKIALLKTFRCAVGVHFVCNCV